MLYITVNRSATFPHITKQPPAARKAALTTYGSFSRARFCCYHDIYNRLPPHPAFRETQVLALLFANEERKPPPPDDFFACPRGEPDAPLRRAYKNKSPAAALGNEEGTMIKIFQIAFALAESPEIAARTGCPLGGACSPQRCRAGPVERKCGLF